jgi:hypothetical protein
VSANNNITQTSFPWLFYTQCISLEENLKMECNDTKEKNKKGKKEEEHGENL